MAYVLIYYRTFLTHYTTYWREKSTVEVQTWEVVGGKIYSHHQIIRAVFQVILILDINTSTSVLQPIPRDSKDNRVRVAAMFDDRNKRS